MDGPQSSGWQPSETRLSYSLRTASTSDSIVCLFSLFRQVLLLDTAFLLSKDGLCVDKNSEQRVRITHPVRESSGLPAKATVAPGNSDEENFLGMLAHFVL
jgi:hypothetical protein